MSVINYKQMLHNSPAELRPQKEIYSPNRMCNTQMKISNTVGLKLNMIKYVREVGNSAATRHLVHL